jgi:hypothetical protein
LDEQQFWAIIEAAGRTVLENRDGKYASVNKQLKRLTPAEAKDFQRVFNQKMVDADWCDLWGAAYLINGGCSDDGFVYFRAWLISMGREVYSAALRNPDSLAGVVDPERDDHEFEDLWVVARQVYEELTGEAMPADDVQWPEKPKGEPWDFEDSKEVSRRFPALARLYI